LKDRIEKQLIKILYTIINEINKQFNKTESCLWAKVSLERSTRFPSIILIFYWANSPHQGVSKSTCNP
jgi:hypothetical protein